MPFQSKAQARGAFGGYFGPAMQAKARQWAHETPGGIRSLPDRTRKPRRRTLASQLTALRGARAFSRYLPE